jgi:hypothetical protein
LTPWQRDPATYGHAALTGSYPTCESDVIRTLTDLLAKRRAYAEHDGERFLDAEQNARLVANAERYYRIMYYGSRASWNLRDSHMFATLKTLLAFHGADSKAVVWAHNSHIGNADATEMATRGEHNIGCSAAKSSAIELTWSVLAPMAERLPRHPSGVAKWRSRRSGQRFPIATSSYATQLVCRASCWGCAVAAICAVQRALANRG